MNRFVVYTHSRPDGTVFYVGKGTLQRSSTLWRNNPHHRNIIAKYGRENIKVKILARDLDEEAAFFYEAETMDILRRRGVSLVNIVDGGGGTSGHRHTEQFKKKMSELSAGNKNRLGIPHTEEAKQKMRSFWNGRVFSEEHRRRLSEAGKCRAPASNETREKIGASRRGKKASIETRLKMSIAHKGKKRNKKCAL